MRAWQTNTGGILLGNRPPPGATSPDPLNLPCGKCLGCSLAIGKAWALRCQLEDQQHQASSFVTLTYDDAHLPPTLQRRDLSAFLKRLRTNATRRATTGPLRFFACGEYGEQNKRPHYHAIVFGLPATQPLLVEDSWGLGFTKTAHATPATIAYTAGYTAKKAGWRNDQAFERIDPETGEVYTWQPPFLQMSRRPGIGAHARQWTNSWRLFAVHNGHPMPVPRFLHEAWKAQATDTQLEELLNEKKQLALTRNTTPESLNAEARIAASKHANRAATRKL